MCKLLINVDPLRFTFVCIMNSDRQYMNYNADTALEYSMLFDIEIFKKSREHMHTYSGIRTHVSYCMKRVASGNHCHHCSVVFVFAVQCVHSGILRLDNLYFNYFIFLHFSNLNQ